VRRARGAFAITSNLHDPGSQSNKLAFSSTTTRARRTRAPFNNVTVTSSTNSLTRSCGRQLTALRADTARGRHHHHGDVRLDQALVEKVVAAFRELTTFSTSRPRAPRDRQQWPDPLVAAASH